METKRSANALAQHMHAKGHTVTVLHGDLTQSEQDRNGARFMSGDVKARTTCVI